MGAQPCPTEDRSLPIAPAYLRLKDAAKYVGISEQMLLKQHRIGDGPPRIHKGRAVLYSVKALHEWMDRDQEAA
jgi:predicted DNA-binding transcriptional regulator AlpA